MVRLIGSLVIATSLLLGLTVLLTPSAQAQTYTVLYDFTGGVDGGNPYAGLTADGAGKFYGTSFYGGAGYGAVLELRRAGTGWLITPLYNFKGGEGDGAGPYATLTIGPDGTLYGTTGSGGGSGCSIFGYSGCGTVFSLRPPPTACKTALCGWTETVLHRFQTHSEGEAPFGAVIFDQAGNLYGTTNGGGLNYGVVYELTPSGQGWNESVLYKFTGQSDGNQPWAGLVFDKAGNLYGTTVYGGDLSCYSGTGCGTVFRLTPSPSGWTENTLYRFHNGGDGEEPFGGLIFDSVGNLYGGNLLGSGGGGTIFRLSSTGGVWTLTTIYSIAGYGGPVASLIMDAAGNLYGTTYADGAYGQGSVFKLTQFNGIWMYADLHDFTGGFGGASPWSSVVMDAEGDILGTSVQGGVTGTSCDPSRRYECGVIFEITP